MKFVLLMNTMSSDSSGINGWNDLDLRRHIAFMRDVDERLRASGELVMAEGLAFPNEAKLVAARRDGPPSVTGEFAASEKFLAGFWIVDVAGEARACDIAAEISAAPGPGNQPLDMPIEVRAIAVAPPA